MVVAGFTGTQKGMTEKQSFHFQGFMETLEPVEFRHGDCIGADAEAHDIVRMVICDAYIVVHPPVNSSKRAWCKGNVVLPVDEYLVRNKHIVDASDILIAAPETKEETLRSGTWSTVRHALKLGKPVYVIYPDGTGEQR